MNILIIHEQQFLIKIEFRKNINFLYTLPLTINIYIYIDIDMLKICHKYILKHYKMI